MKVRFRYYRSKELWYEVCMPFGKDGIGFIFPVPIDDTGTGTFLAEDKAILFMRYIRKHLEKLKAENNQSTKEGE